MAIQKTRKKNLTMAEKIKQKAERNISRIKANQASADLDTDDTRAEAASQESDTEKPQPKALVGETLRLIPTEMIRVFEGHDRIFVNHKMVDKYAAEFAETNGLGQLVPAIVRKISHKTKRDAELDGKLITEEYEVIAGLHRYLAAKKAGVELKAEIKVLTDIEAHRVMRAENDDRTDISYWEKCVYLAGMKAQQQYTFEKIVDEKIAPSRATATRMMRCARLPMEMIAKLDDPRTLAPKKALTLIEALEKDESLEATKKSESFNIKEAMKALAVVENGSIGVTELFSLLGVTSANDDAHEQDDAVDAEDEIDELEGDDLTGETEGEDKEQKEPPQVLFAIGSGKKPAVKATVNRAGHLSIKVNASKIDPEQRERFESELESLMREHFPDIDPE